jgi:hypothetical protein
MEFIQYFAYPVVDQCGYGTNLFLSEISTYHISLQALAIMPALATYSPDKTALIKATRLGATLSGMFLIFHFLALALSGFLWKNNWKIATYHFIGAMMTLFMPQWLFGVTTGEAAAMYCFYSIPITLSFMPYFKEFFTVKTPDIQGELAYKVK